MMNNEYESDWGVSPITKKTEKKSSNPSYEEDWDIHPIHTFIGDVPAGASLPTLQQQELRSKQFTNELKKQLVNPQAGKEFLIGGLQGLSNLPIDISNLAIKGGNWLNSRSAEPIPEIPRFNFAPKTVASRTGDILSGLIPLPSAITKLGPAFAAVANASGKKVISPLKIFQGLGRKNIKQLSTAEQAALEEAKLASAQTAQSEGYSKYETGMTNPSAMRRAALQKSEAASLIPENTQENLPILSSQKSAEELSNAQQLHENSLKQLSDIENNMSEHLNKGASHDTRVAKQLFAVHDAERKELNKGYDNLTEDLSQKHVAVDNTEKIQHLNGQLMTLLKKDFQHTPESNEIVNEIEQLKNMPQVFRADKYLTMIRSAKDFARHAREKAFSPNMNAAERQEWEHSYNNLDKMIEEMEDNFENSISKDDSRKLKKLNTAWRTRVKPLQRNSTYQTIRFRGRINGNIMNTLRGTDPGDVIMRQTIKNNPEIAKNVVGQEFSKNPEKLHQAGELEQEYLDNMPQLQQMLAKHKQISESIPFHENLVKNAEKNHLNVIKQEKNAHDVVASRQQESIKNTNKKAQLTKEVDDLNKHIKLLEESKNKKKVSLEKHVKIEKELYNAKKIRSKKIKTLRNIGIAALLLSGGKYSYSVYKGIQSGSKAIAGED